MSNPAEAHTNRILINALNAACRSIQDDLGVKDGDVAGLFFDDDKENEFRDLFRPYVKMEINYQADAHAEGVIKAVQSEMTKAIAEGATWIEVIINSNKVGSSVTKRRTIPITTVAAE